MHDAARTRPDSDQREQTSPRPNIEHSPHAGQQRLKEFFNSASAQAYIITGHTDSRASDAYNMRLSYNRANSVARVGASTGARIVDVRGYGERLPAAANNTAAGMAKNRRVEAVALPPAR